MKTGGWKSCATAPGAPQRNNRNTSVFDIRIHKTTPAIAQRQKLDEQTCPRTFDSAAAGYHGGRLGSSSHRWMFPITLPKWRPWRCVPAPGNCGCLFFWCSLRQRWVSHITGAFLLRRTPDGMFLELDNRFGRPVERFWSLRTKHLLMSALACFDVCCYFNLNSN